MDIYQTEWRDQSAPSSTNIRAEFDEDGSLKISGQDMGPKVQEFWKGADDEYEYSMEFSPDDVKTLFLAILKETFNSDQNLTFERIMVLSESESIEANFFSWP